MNTAAVTEARDRLAEIIDDVAATNTEWIITRHGRPVAVVLSVDEYESLVESLNILSDDETVEAIDEALTDLADGRTELFEA